MYLKWDKKLKHTCLLQLLSETHFKIFISLEARLLAASSFVCDEEISVAILIAVHEFSIAKDTIISTHIIIFITIYVFAQSIF